MALREFFPSYRNIIQKIFHRSFLTRKASFQVASSTATVSASETLFITEFFHKNVPIKFNRTVTSVLPTLNTAVKLPHILEKVNMEYRLPTPLVKDLIVNQDLPILSEKVDPLVNNWEISNPNIHPVVRKEAARMIQIRRRKMKTHKRKKLKKRMRFLWQRLRFRREQRKENVFKEELYEQVKKTESFNAELYVADILHRINNKPHIETKEERQAKIRELIKENRSNVTFVRPDYNDIK